MDPPLNWRQYKHKQRKEALKGFLSLGYVVIPILFYVGLRILGLYWEYAEIYRNVSSVPLSTIEEVFADNVLLGQTIKLRGGIVAEKPMRSELEDVPRVYSHFTLKQEWKRYEQKPTSGRTRPKSGEETIVSRGYYVPFSIQDSSGTIQVDPAGIRLTHGIVHELDTNGAHPVIKKYEGAIKGARVKDATGKYLYKETILPVDDMITITGQLSKRSGIPTLHAPESSPLYITMYSNENELRVLQSKKRHSAYFAAGLLLFSGSLIMHKFFVWRKLLFVKKHPKKQRPNQFDMSVRPGA